MTGQECLAKDDCASQESEEFGIINAAAYIGHTADCGLQANKAHPGL